MGNVIYRWLNRMSRGVIGIVVDTVVAFTEARAAQAAAAIAYYTLFSLFPILLLLITFASTILKNQEVVEIILNYTAEALPTSQALIRQNIQQALNLRGPVGLVAIIGLLWGATSVFVLLTDNINLAWHSSKPRHFLQSRLIGLFIIFVLGILLILSVVSSTLFSLLPRLDFAAPLWGGVLLYETFTWEITSRLVPWFFIFLMFLSLYRWLPNTKVHWSEAFWGALVATVAWEVTKSGFGWYLSSGLVQYQLVYGSLGTVVAFMLWIYLTSVIILFGAHLSAAITKHNQSPQKNAEPKRAATGGRPLRQRK